MTVPTNGKLKHDVIVLDGDEVRRVRKNGHHQVLFNLFERGLVTDWTPRGIAWVSTEQRFVFHDLFAPSHATNELVFFDADGNLDRRVEVVYPDGTQIRNIDGMTYIPPSSSVWPDCLAVNLMDENFQAQVVIINRDGVVLDLFRPDAPVGTNYAVAISYASGPDRLVVSIIGSDELYDVGFDGTVSGPYAPPVRSIEAVVEAHHKGFWVASYRGVVVQAKRDFSAGKKAIDAVNGPGVHRPFAVAHDQGEFGFLQSLEVPELAVMPDAYDRVEPLFQHTVFVGATDLTIVPGTGLYGSVAPGALALLLYDRAQDVLLDPISVAGALGGDAPRRVAYVEPTGEFLVRGSGSPAKLVRVGFDGLAIGEIDFGTTLGVSAIQSVSWRRTASPLGELIVVADGRLWVTELDGHYLADHALPLAFTGDVEAINDGAYAGQLAVLEGQDTSRLYRFSLP